MELMMTLPAGELVLSFRQSRGTVFAITTCGVFKLVKSRWVTASDEESESFQPLAEQPK